MEAYADAIKAVVRTNDVVIDVGTGTGILSFLAAKYGAVKSLDSTEPVSSITPKRSESSTFLMRRLHFCSRTCSAKIYLRSRQMSRFVSYSEILVLTKM